MSTLDKIIQIANSKPQHQLDCKRCAGKGYVYGNTGQTCWKCNGTLKYDNKWLRISKSAQSLKNKLTERAEFFKARQEEVDQRAAKRLAEGRGVAKTTFRQDRLNQDIEMARNSLKDQIKNLAKEVGDDF